MADDKEKVDWVAKIEKIDPRKASVQELVEKFNKAGQVVSSDADHPENTSTTEVVVEGFPAPKKKS